MDKIKSLNNYQKGILVFMIAMALIFAVVYPKTLSKVGYNYNDAILVPIVENDNTVYSGKIKGEQAEFIVFDDHTVAFQYGDKNYGTYILKEDPTAVPNDSELKEEMIGIEICNGDEIFFRGAVLDFGDEHYLYNEDGTLDYLSLSFVTTNGIEMDENGEVIDRMEPTASDIYELLKGPKLTHKGEALAWYGAAAVCVLNTLSMLFADELFRWNLLFQIRNVENAEPSEWEIASRYIGWTVITIMALVIFVTGLQ